MNSGESRFIASDAKKTHKKAFQRNLSYTNYHTQKKEPTVAALTMPFVNSDCACRPFTYFLCSAESFFFCWACSVPVQNAEENRQIETKRREWKRAKGSLINFDPLISSDVTRVNNCYMRNSDEPEEGREAATSEAIPLFINRKSMGDGTESRIVALVSHSWSRLLPCRKSILCN